MKNILLIGWLLILNYQLLFAVEDLRRCVKNDLIGTWTVTHKIFLNESLKKEYSHLLMPVQILMYRSDNKLRSLYSTSKDKTLKQHLSLLKFPQNDTYEIVKKGVVVVSRDNQIVDMYTCDYLIKGSKKKNIESGSIMLTRVIEKKPAIVNIFKKLNP
ncbi:MAG: hypothetical protein MJK08_05750 [Campylobacterales bacterium]|nr:hypothetical protein [Campylobacterales bacterium]NQY53896.1 hypothetical protein [Campylobacteraceae bacterium]